MAASNSYYLSRAVANIRAKGRRVVVERWPSGAQAATLSQTLWCIPLAGQAEQQQIVNEGDTNAGNAQPYKFIFEGSADVQETIDRVRFRGWYYQVVTCVPLGEIAGSATAWLARCIRTTKVTDTLLGAAVPSSDLVLIKGVQRPIVVTETAATGTLTVTSAPTFTLYDDTGTPVTGFNAIALTSVTGSGTAMVQAIYNLDTSALALGYYRAVVWLPLQAQDGLPRKLDYEFDIYIREAV